MTFWDCVKFCELEGARMPCVASREDHDVLWARAGEENVWIGLFQTEAGDNAVYGGIDGTCDSTVTLWSPDYGGQPDGAEQRCNIIQLDGEWHDDTCVWGGGIGAKCVCQPTTEPAAVDFNWLGGEIHGHGTTWVCGEGEQPNAEHDGCEECGAGKYSSVGLACTSCAAGKYGVGVGSASEDGCLPCESGLFSGQGASACVSTMAHTADHAWDFRGCSNDAPIVDSAGGLGATLMNGAICAADGVSFDGEDDYVDLEDWEWGGALTIEVYAKYERFNYHSNVVSFSNGYDSDNVYLANREVNSQVVWNVRRGDNKRVVDGNTWDEAAWTHVVVTASGTTMEVFKDGILVGVIENGHEPLVLTRTQHWLGRSAFDHPPYSYFEGSIAYVRMWHGVALGEGEVEALYLEREVQ
jgi:hypothetical protein